jgi:hypothetical protein
MLNGLRKGGFAELTVKGLPEIGSYICCRLRVHSETDPLLQTVEVDILETSCAVTWRYQRVLFFCLLAKADPASFWCNFFDLWLLLGTKLRWGFATGVWRAWFGVLSDFLFQLLWFQ